MFRSDDRVPDDFQAQFLALGKRLRGNLLNLLSAHFDTDTAALTKTNARLSATNASVSQYAEDLQKATKVVKDLTQVAKGLDDLLQFAAGTAKFI
jgi:hypothetical protein